MLVWDFLFVCFGRGFVVLFFFPSLPVHIDKAIAVCFLQSTRAYYKGCARMKLGSAASIKFPVSLCMKPFLLATSLHFVYRLPGAVSKKKNRKRTFSEASTGKEDK